MSILIQITNEIESSITGLRTGNVSPSLVTIIEELIHNNSLLENSFPTKVEERSVNKKFTAAICNLFSVLNLFGDGNSEMEPLSAKVRAILMKPEMASNLIYLPYKPGLSTCIQIFRSLINENVSWAMQNFAAWIEYWRLDLKKLEELSKDELLMLAPHFKYLNLNVDSLSEDEIHNLIQHCVQLEELHLSTARVVTTPVLPETLKKFVCIYNDNLREIASLPSHLNEFRCICNELLRVIPELPRSLDSCVIEENPSLDS